MKKFAITATSIALVQAPWVVAALILAAGGTGPLAWLIGAAGYVTMVLITHFVSEME